MLNDKKLTQEGGDNSTNYQANTIVVKQGMSYEDAREIALDVFKSNYLTLSQKAAETAIERVKVFTDNLLKELMEREPEAIKNMEKPDIQNAVFVGQRAYAYSGDDELGKLLIEVLVERATLTERTLTQIVLHESLSIIPKLTAIQLDTLTLLLILRWTRTDTCTTMDEVRESFTEQFSPFIKSLSSNSVDFQHLQYTGCLSIGGMPVSLGTLLRNQFPNIFFRGFTREEFEKLGMSMDQFPELIIPCVQNPELYQVNATSEEELNDCAEKLNIPSGTKNTYWWFLTTHRMMSGEIEEYAKGITPFMPDLFSKWNSSYFNSSELSSVGMVIGAFNYRQKTGKSMDTKVWFE